MRPTFTARALAFAAIAALAGCATVQPVTTTEPIATDAANPRFYNDPKGAAASAQKGNPNGHIMLTQKLFEYLATKKPILAVAPGGALADLVRRRDRP